MEPSSLLGTFVACEGAEFTGVTEQGESGQAGQPIEVAGGAPSHVGGQPTSAGEPNLGGEAPAVGGAGEGGMPSGGCGSIADCGAGTFCRQGSCVACSDLNDLATLDYGNPEPLEVINATAGLEGMRFPRPTGQGLGLIYVRDFFGGHLWFTSDATESAGVALPAPQEGFESGLYRAERLR